MVKQNKFKLVNSGIKNTMTNNILKVSNFKTKKGLYSKRFQNAIPFLTAAEMNKLNTKHKVKYDDLLKFNGQGKGNETVNIKSLTGDVLKKNNKIMEKTQAVVYDKTNKKFYNKKWFYANRNVENLVVKGNVAETPKNSKTLLTANKNDIIKKLSDLNTGKKNKVKIDMTKINIPELMKLIKHNVINKRLLATANDGLRNITLSNKTVDKILKEYTKVDRQKSSDAEFIREERLSRFVELSVVTDGKRNKDGKLKIKGDGGYFKYLNNTKFNFSRYGVYKNVKKNNYNDNCLYLALKHGGLTQDKLNELKTVVLNRCVPLCKLNQICDMLNINIHLRFLKGDKVDVKNYGDVKNETYKIGLLDNHYFIIEKTEINSFCLENYDEIKNLERCNEINKVRIKKGKKYYNREKKFIDSFNVVKILLNNKDRLLKKIVYGDDILKTQFYDQSFDFDNLNYDEKTSCKLNELKDVDNADYFKVFFDFETYANDDGIHKPYLCHYVTEKSDVRKEYIGYDCAKQMMDDLPRKKKIIMIAHNCGYDYRFVFNLLCQINPIIKGNSLMSCDAVYYRNFNKNEKIEIKMKDSYKLITMPLNKFGESFNLTQEKEIMPYDIYTEQNINKINVSLESILKSPKLKKKEDVKKFISNCEKWDCFITDDKIKKVNIIKYSSEYCHLDCVVLKKGYEVYKSWMNELTGLNIDNIISLASLANKYLVKEGCYDGVYQLSGIPRHFIQKCVVGGRTMINSNKKEKVNKILDDFDAVSLYPSAMFRMVGFLKGKPKVIKTLNYKWLQNETDGYFIKIIINNVGIKRDFPLMSFMNDDGVRIFCNDMIGKEIYVDKTTLEDLIEFQKVEFDILQGYYFDEGRNKEINSVIEKLFNGRLKKKKEENPIQQAYKDLMNSSYGKSILKPIETDTKIVSDKNFTNFLSYNYNYVKEYTKVNNKYIVKMYKPILSHFNNAHVGVEILSMSKRIMNEVMTLSEDNGFNIYYQDTDSMHIESDNVKLLSELFKKKYNRELIGDNMGQFHVDFSLKNDEEVECKNVVSTESIFLGKKCYADKLRGEIKNEENGETEYVYGYHVRMKGVSNASIQHKADTEYEGDLMKIYEDLYNGKTLTFDLLAGGDKVCFQYNKDMTISTASEFTRKISF